MIGDDATGANEKTRGDEQGDEKNDERKRNSGWRFLMVVVDLCDGCGLVVVVVRRVVVVMSALMVVVMNMIASFVMFVMFVMVIVLAGFAVDVIVGAGAGLAIPVDEVEGCEKDESDSGEQCVDPEARIEVFFDSSARVELEEDSSPDEEGDERENCEEFLHDRRIKLSFVGSFRGESKSSLVPR